jgi:hypothetical protein
MSKVAKSPQKLAKPDSILPVTPFNDPANTFDNRRQTNNRLVMPEESAQQ